ncbi:ThiL Thiamine monophosphate kinase [Burkholderiaceae bacterium]|jgi:thiamine-monophosphate kinase
MTAPAKLPLGSSLSEFALIESYFKQGALAMAQTARVATNELTTIALGIGDDCALLQTNGSEILAISTDMLLEGRHFLPGANAQWLGHKALAVNLSDLAAMGAKPLAFTLALALPASDTVWLNNFSTGLFQLATQFNCHLIGGDTTSGPLTMSITIIGSVGNHQALRRAGAKLGDDIWVSGCVGDARLALGALRKEWSISDLALAEVLPRMHLPTPRIDLGLGLRSLASAAIDISDGLLGDLRHLLRASHLGAVLELAALPISATLANQPEIIRWQCAAAGGDDYELCFTAAAEKRDQITVLSQTLSLPLTRIGYTTISTEAKIELIDSQGQALDANKTANLLRSFDHFD